MSIKSIIYYIGGSSISTSSGIAFKTISGSGGELVIGHVGCLSKNLCTSSARSEAYFPCAASEMIRILHCTPSS